MTKIDLYHIYDDDIDLGFYTKKEAIEFIHQYSNNTITLPNNVDSNTIIHYVEEIGFNVKCHNGVTLEIAVSIMDDLIAKFNQYREEQNKKKE